MHHSRVVVRKWVFGCVMHNQGTGQVSDSSHVVCAEEIQHKSFLNKIDCFVLFFVFFVFVFTVLSLVKFLFLTLILICQIEALIKLNVGFREHKSC